ncbi:hypothetical protein P7C71_g1356, partial [Lecanoromycetidae sp. Uapishka_2]
MDSILSHLWNSPTPPKGVERIMVAFLFVVFCITVGIIALSLALKFGGLLGREVERVLKGLFSCCGRSRSASIEIRRVHHEPPARAADSDVAAPAPAYIAGGEDLEAAVPQVWRGTGTPVVWWRDESFTMSYR